MDLAFNIVVGNAISLIAGIFIILSMWVNDEKKAYKYQFLNAFILAISSVFFFSWTGVVTMAIAASRNLMVYYERLTWRWTVFFIILSVVLGLLVNTMGFVGILPIIAIVQITLCNYYLTWQNDHGQIIQSGSHEDLVHQETGKYYALWNAQAQYYGAHT